MYSCNPVSLIDSYLLIDPATAAASQANREEIDARSVFVGNVSSLPPVYMICTYSTVLVLFSSLMKWDEDINKLKYHPSGQK